MMVKEKILIRKLSGTCEIQKTDEVAVEGFVEILLRNGENLMVSCTPAFVEELILGRRYVLGDFSEDEKRAYGVEAAPEQFGRERELCNAVHELYSVQLREIFTLAEQSFEQAGSLFADTGCAHSCALVYQGAVVCSMEDIGRHNALDKVIGAALRKHIPLGACYIITSGRISGDYLQKVMKAGIPMAVSKAAVTNRAVELAAECGVTLLGFVRKNTANLYCEGQVKVTE